MPTAHATRPDPGLVMLDPVTMSTELGTVATRVTVTYGVAVDGVRPTAVAEDDDLRLLLGGGDRAVTVQLADAADAEEHAAWLLEQYAPAWYLPTATVLLADAVDAQVAAYADLLEGDPVLLEQLPAGGPMPTYAATLLGATESVSATDWQLQLHLSQGGG
jgi:hypothetical protein